MSVKSTKQEAPVSSIGYPKLMISVNGDVVLFAKIKEGTLVFDNGYQHKLGDYVQTWNMDFFTDYTKSIVLSNES